MSLDIAWGVVRTAVGCALVFAVARRLAPVVDRSNARAERIVTTLVSAAWLVTLLVAGLAAVGRLGATALVATTAALFAGAVALRRGRPAPLLPPRGAERLALAWPLLLAAPILAWDVAWRLPAAPSDWDALTYHLYLPARWLQAGGFVHVPTVFGDPAAAFAPQNGALLYAWWLALAGGDALTNVVNVLPAVVLALSIGALAARCGARAENAALAGVAVFWIGPMRSAVFEARVDAPMLAFWAASLALVARALDRDAPPSWLAAGLATGLAAGTKVVGLVLVAPQAAVLAGVLLARRDARACAGFAAACLAGGGWWYVANAVRFGNPLFPLDLAIGGVRVLPGAIPFDALAGQFHASIPDLAFRVLPHFYGPAALFGTLVGAAALAGGALRAERGRPARALAAGVALWWASFYFFRLPHNTETRFLLPVVALATTGFALLVEPLARKSPWLARGAWALVFAASFADAERAPHWRAALASPRDAGVPLAAWTLLFVSTTAALATAFFARSRAAACAAAVVAAAGVALAVGAGEHYAREHRAVHYAKSRFREWSPAFRAVDRLDPTEARRVAYTGLNLPYALTGAHQSRFVRYVNTQGSVDDGFYDFWRRDPILATRQKPGLYRGGGRDDYAAWVRNLEAARIDWLAVFRLHAQERRYLEADADGFPIERAWAAGHPDRFAPLASGPAFALFAVRSAR